MTYGDIYEHGRPKCPVCGHADFETFEDYDGEVSGRTVDHAACAIALQEKISKLQQDIAAVVETAVEEYVALVRVYQRVDDDERPDRIGDIFRTRLLNKVLTGP